MVSALKRGDEIVTSGGIVGKIEKVYDDDKLDLVISENVTIKVQTPEDGCAYASSNNIPHIRAIYQRLQKKGWDMRYHDKKMFFFEVNPKQKKWVEVS